MLHCGTSVGGGVPASMDCPTAAPGISFVSRTAGATQGAWTVRIDLGAGRILPRWVAAFFLGCAVVLIPWIVLMFTVPQVVNVQRHWELVWGGFDCFLVLGFAVTAFRLMTRSPRGAVTAAMTGTMLLIDAWFDVLTTHRGGLVVSILMAVFAEIPCAIICFYVSRRIMSLFEQARDHLSVAGFQVQAGRLVPPAGFPRVVPSAGTSLCEPRNVSGSEAVRRGAAPAPDPEAYGSQSGLADPVSEQGLFAEQL